MDLRGGFELVRLLEQFFDKALYYATLGYHSAKPETAERAGEAATANIAQFVP